MLVVVFCTITIIMADTMLITALLKQQGVNTKGILKGSPVKEELPPLPSLNGKLEVLLAA